MSLLNQNLQAFMAIVKRGTVHAAADDLGLTQTGVTQRIRALEAELGTTLFLRSRKGMQLTSEGEALLRYCHGATDLEGQALSQIKGQAKASEIQVSIVGPTSVMTARIVDACIPLYQNWPQLNLNFIIDDAPNRLDYLRKAQAQLAIVPPEQVTKEMDSKMLKPDKYILVASSKWKGRKLEEILNKEKAIDFYENDQTTIQYLKHHNLLSQMKKPRLYANNNESIIKLFKQGIGYGTLTQEIAKPHLTTGELITLNSSQQMEDPLALTWYPRPQMPEYLQAIIKSIK